MKLERIEDPWGDVWCHSDDVEKLEALNAELLEACKAAVAIAKKAYVHWGAEEDMKAGKLLLALAGGRVGYNAQIDAIHAAIAKAEGAQP